MLDGMMPEETKVWGFTVPVSSAGRRKWPEARRDQVVEKINNGAGIRETAEEIGANKSLVALWVKKAEHLMRLVSAMIGPSPAPPAPTTG